MNHRGKSNMIKKVTILIAIFGLAITTYSQDDLRKRKLLRIEFVADTYGGATVSWDANSEIDLVGYKIYYGKSSGSYESQVYVGNVTSYRLTGLEEGRRYYFVATALDFSGNESGFSNEVNGVPGSVLPDSIQIFSVLADGSGAESRSLRSGVTYIVTVSGTVQFWLPYFRKADADWSEWDTGGVLGWQNRADVGLRIDGMRIPQPTFSSTHIYNYKLIGSGVPLIFTIFDSYYRDNSGSLNIRIKEE